MDRTRHLRVLRPHPGILAFYDGRVPGHRFAPDPNWVDDGALSLGIASYALISGSEALVYDTHVTLDHAEAVLGRVRAEGARRITVVLSHCHLDHVAGTAVFAGCDVIANARTAAHLTRDRAAIEGGTLSGPPAISPLVLPTRVFGDRLSLRIGTVEVELIAANIHSDDATVVWLPESRILLAGDTVEDTVTYVGDPGAFAQHLIDLDRLAALGPRQVLPCHGAAEVIAAGGYGPALLPATADYLRWLMRLRDEPHLADTPLAKVIAAPLAAGTLRWFEPYRAIHAQNVARTLENFGRG